MSIATLTLQRDIKSQFFSGDTLEYFLPHIICVTEIRSTQMDTVGTGSCYGFTVYFTYGIVVEMAFENSIATAAARKDIISNMMDYWGPDQVVFSNGFDYDVTVIHAIKDVTPVVEKDHHAGFAVTISGVARPMYLVFPEIISARASYHIICAKLERRRRTDVRGHLDRKLRFEKKFFHEKKGVRLFPSSPPGARVPDARFTQAKVE